MKSKERGNREVTLSREGKVEGGRGIVWKYERKYGK